MWVWRSEQRLPVLVFTARARRVYVSCAEPCRQQRSGGVHVSASTVKQHVLHRRLNAQRRFVEDRDSQRWKPGLTGPESFSGLSHRALVWEFCGC